MNCEYCKGTDKVLRGEQFVECNHDGTATFYTNPKREIAAALIEADGDNVSDYEGLEEFAETLEDYRAS